jgi:putative transposase
VWLWVAIEPIRKEILSIDISIERNMFVAQRERERFISNLIKFYGKHPVSTDGERTWYPPQACRFLQLKHHIHPSFEKSNIIERTMHSMSRIELQKALMLFSM